MQKIYKMILIFAINASNCLYAGEGFLATRVLTKQQLKNLAGKGYNLTGKVKQVALKPGEISINVGKKIEGKLQSLAKGKSLRADVYVEVGDDLARTIKGAKIEKVEDGGYLIKPPIKKEAIKTTQYRYRVSPEGVASTEPFEVEKKLSERIKDKIKSLKKENRERIAQEQYLEKVPTINLNLDMLPLKMGDTVSGKFKVVLPGQPEALMHGTIINTGERYMFIEYAGKEGLFAKAEKMVKGAEGQTVPAYVIMKSPSGVYSLGSLGTYTLEGSRGLKGVIDDLVERADKAAEKVRSKLSETTKRFKEPKNVEPQKVLEGVKTPIDSSPTIAVSSAPPMPKEAIIPVSSTGSGSSLYPSVP